MVSVTYSSGPPPHARHDVFAPDGVCLCVRARARVHVGMSLPIPAAFEALAAPRRLRRDVGGRPSEGGGGKGEGAGRAGASDRGW